MPYREGEYVSPRVSKELLHPDSLDAADAPSVVIKGKPNEYFFNYQVQLCAAPDETYIACWTQGSYESDPDQRVVISRSKDGMSSWGEPLVVESAASRYRVPAWIVSFVVPHSGRVYVFYWYNINGVALRDAGDLFYRYSDDAGVSWSERYRVGLPRSSMDDAYGDLHGWNFGQPRILPTGQVMMTYAKIKRSSLYPEGWRLTEENEWQRTPQGDPGSTEPTVQGGPPNNWYTEIFLLEMSNILTEPDPARLTFRVLPEGAEGLWVPYPGSDRHWGQEGSLAGLSSGRLLCVMRTRLGHPYFSVSNDRAGSWSRPQPLRFCPGGAAFDHPNSPCPIFKLRDGRFVLLLHNSKPEGRGWHPRDPLWIAVGREAPRVDQNAGLFFGKPRILVYNDGKPGGPFKDFEICYPSVYQFGERVFVAYANKTSEILVQQIPETLLDDRGLPV